MEFKHQTYNPMWAGLSMLCANMESDGWAPSHVVTVTQYEAVAVFARAIPSKNEESEVRFSGDYL